MRLGRGTTRAERVRSTSAVVAGVTVPAVLAIMAVIDPGVKIAEVDLNDGAVWVTNRSELKLGRYDATVRELNGGLVATDPSFDVLQSGQDVLLVEPGRVSTVDPATMALTTQAEVPAGSQVAMGAGVVAVTSPEGSVWVRTMTSLASVTSDTPGDIDLGDGGMAVVDPDGLVLALDPTDGTVHRGEMVDGALAVTDAGTLEGAAGVEPEAVTAVDGTLVMLADGTLHGDGWTTDLVDGAAPVLQQPSTSGTSVAVGTTTHLLEVDLRSGDVAVTPTSGQGTPAAPVRLGDCLYGAWASPTGSYLVRCGDDEPTLIDLERMTAQSTPVFRVNRSVVALNDTLQGLLWLPDDMPRVQVPNWDQIEQDDDTTDTEDESDEVETTQQQLTECTPESAAPGAVDDDLAVRARPSSRSSTTTRPATAASSRSTRSTRPPWTPASRQSRRSTAGVRCRPWCHPRLRAVPPSPTRSRTDGGTARPRPRRSRCAPPTPTATRPRSSCAQDRSRWSRARPSTSTPSRTSSTRTATSSCCSTP